MNKFERDDMIEALESGIQNNLETIGTYKNKIKELEQENKEYEAKIKEMEETPYESANMKIIEITSDYIKFDNNYVIKCARDCSDWSYNYADFEQLKDTGIENYSFKFIEFEKVDGSGFRFGDDMVKVFVPCYSEQNGYYSTDLDIYLNDKKVLEFDDLQIV